MHALFRCRSMRTLRRLFAALLLVTALVPTPVAQAQEGSRALGTGASATVGLTWDYVMFGDDAPRAHEEIGWTIGAQVWHRTSEKTALMFEAAYQLNALENPHFDEAYRSLYLMFGIQKGGQWYIRPNGGVVIRFWEEGGEPGPTSVGPALGVAFGYHYPLNDSFQVSAEGTVRLSFEIGVVDAQLGFQLPVGWFSSPE